MKYKDIMQGAESAESAEAAEADDLSNAATPNASAASAAAASNAAAPAAAAPPAWTPAPFPDYTWSPQTLAMQLTALSAYNIGPAASAVNGQRLALQLAAEQRGDGAADDNAAQSYGRRDAIAIAQVSAPAPAPAPAPASTPAAMAAAQSAMLWPVPQRVIYCTRTGQPWGEVTETYIQHALRHLTAATNSRAVIRSTIENTRYFGGPCPTWQSTAPDQLKHNRLYDPCGYLVYVLQQMLQEKYMSANANKVLQRAYQRNPLHYTQSRIYLYQHLQNLDANFIRWTADAIAGYLGEGCRIRSAQLPSIHLRDYNNINIFQDLITRYSKFYKRWARFRKSAERQRHPNLQRASHAHMGIHSKLTLQESAEIVEWRLRIAATGVLNFGQSDTPTIAQQSEAKLTQFRADNAVRAILRKQTISAPATKAALSTPTTPLQFTIPAAPAAPAAPTAKDSNNDK